MNASVAAFEALESRQMLATFVVTNTDDSGAGSLRQAIIDSNTAGGADVINFTIPSSGNAVVTIKPLTVLPTITDAVTIDGYTQAGSTMNTATMDQPINAVLKVEINGSLTPAIPGGGNNLLQLATVNSVIRGLVLNGLVEGNAIVLSGGGQNAITGNFIGTDATGLVAANPNASGVFIYNGSSANDVGGTLPAKRYLIAGNGGSGISVGSTGSVNNTIRGNFIGTNKNGNAALPNEIGIAVNSIPNSNLRIGGNSLAAGNLISGNKGAGILIQNLTSGVTIQGNKIGTDRTAFYAVPNSASTLTPANTGFGILIIDLNSGAPTNNLIGCYNAGEGNIIAANASDGIAILNRNGFATPVGNVILGNSIYYNGGLGIDLGDNGVTLNDGGDGDGGANNQQNFPVITRMEPEQIGNAAFTRAVGTLNSTPLTWFRVEFYSTIATSAVVAEGMTFVGAANVFTDSFGEADFDVLLDVYVANGYLLTATATRLTGGLSPIETSEFSLAVGTPAVVEPTPDPNDTLVTKVDGQLKIHSGSNANKFTITILKPAKGTTQARYQIKGIGSSTINGQKSLTIAADGIANIVTGNKADEVTIIGGKKFKGGVNLTNLQLDMGQGNDKLTLKNVNIKSANGGHSRLLMSFGSDRIKLTKVTIDSGTTSDLLHRDYDFLDKTKSTLAANLFLD